jgi:hypothetical protein
MAENYEGLIGVPATDLNFPSGIGRLSDGILSEFRARLIELEASEGGHKGRIKAVEKELKNRGTVSVEVRAVEVVAADIKAAEERFADGMPYELDRIENEIRFFQDKAGEALLEMGKRLIRIKAHEGHGQFLASLERLGMTTRSAQYSMAAARKFSNTQSTAYLGNEKLRALTVLDDDEIQTLDDGGVVKGMTLDDIERMSVRELRDNLREEREKAKKEKEGRKKDRETQEAAFARKDQEICELEQQLRYQQPPTKEQTALAELLKLAGPYTFALAEVNAAVRKAYALVKEAEKVPGADVLMLNGWFNQFSPEMTTFAELHQAWTDEVDEAHPIETGKITLESDKGKKMPGSWSAPGSGHLDVPGLG